MRPVVKTKFKDLYLLPSRNGVSKPSRVRGTGYPMVNMKEIFKHDWIDQNVEMELVPLTSNETASSLLEYGDLLFARQSLVREGAGKCVVYMGEDDKVTFESHLIRVRLSRKKANPLFYYYFFNSPIGKSRIQTIVNQVAAAGIRGSDLQELVVPYIGKDFQNYFAETIKTYDDLIKNNERRIKILEEMAQRLYTEWFIKFKFPGHEKVKLVDSGTKFGKIPEGWEVKSIGDMLAKVKRKTKIPASEYLEDGEFPVVDQGNDFIAGFTNDETAIYEEELIVFGDHSRCFKFCNFKFACGADGTQLLLSNDIQKMPQKLFYLTVMNSGLQNFGYSRHFKFLKSLKIVVPDGVTAGEFSNLFNNAFDQMRQLQQQNAILAKMRDLLIPQLVSGKRELK